MSSAAQLQVIIATGPADPHRAVLGLALAASAAAAGTRVTAYFAMQGAQLLKRENCAQSLLPGYPSAAEFVEIILSSDGVVEYCPNCIDGECAVQFEGRLVEAKVCQLAKPGGMSAVALRMSSMPTVVF